MRRNDLHGANAQAANRAYLTSLSPDRLLHNFHKAADLPPRGAIYGGWESQSIAGHTLGHYLSAGGRATGSGLSFP